MAKKKDESKVMPRLRFPEFSGTEGWEARQLSNSIDLLSGLHLSPDEYGTDGEIPYFTGPSDFTNKMDGVTKWTTASANDAKAFDTLITVKGSGVGELWYLAIPSVALGRQLMAIRTRDCDSRFIFQLLQTKRVRFEDLASGNLIPGLTRSDILDFIAFFPSVEEQQKIADCLSSLDELIVAQGRKVEALKAHKRGLMQELFPREGESVPRLRFPEFWDGPEWKETRLDQLGRLISGLTYKPNDVREEGLLVLRSSNIHNAEITLEDRVYVAPDIRGANLSELNDILICVRNGSKTLIGKSAMIPEGMPLCTHGAFMTVFRAHAPYFVFQLMQSTSFNKQVAADLGATINSINGSQLLKYRFFVPEPDEQNRIAECLSSLSASIAAETQKLESLKAFKKGLMQQLFPSPEGD
jgi:type I restriction enzyme S subunit